MKKGYRRAIFMLLLLLIASLGLTGCKASKKKVEESTYYKKLLKKYNNLKSENEKLQEASDSQEEVTDSEKRSEKYLAKIARDSLVKLEVGYADDMVSSTFVEHEGVFDVATRLAEEADRTTKYTPEELEKVYDARYKYILYDEDNAIYEITVYGSDYIVFSDLPKYVYYAPNASVLGDAFLHYRSSYPESRLLHRLADCPLMIDSKGRAYDNSTVVDTANYINKMNKKKSSREKAEKTWKKRAKISVDAEVDTEDYYPESKTYTYFTHGNIMTITMYDYYINIKNVNGERTWYNTSRKNIQAIKNILRKVREENAAEESSEDSSKESTSQETSHEKEIEEESVVGDN